MYVIHMRDGRSMADASKRNHLAVLGSFFQTVLRRMKLPTPTSELDEVEFCQKAPKRTYLTKREADVLLSSISPKTQKHQPAANRLPTSS